MSSSVTKGAKYETAHEKVNYFVLMIQKVLENKDHSFIGGHLSMFKDSFSSIILLCILI